jgi:hypothetical protein
VDADKKHIVAALYERIGDLVLLLRLGGIPVAGLFFQPGEVILVAVVLLGSIEYDCDAHDELVLAA